MQLWSKGTPLQEKIEQFTTGKDRELDLLLAPYDVLGSMAHIQMLHKVGLLDSADLKRLTHELKQIYSDVLNGSFTISPGVEDVHSQIEFLLTERLGVSGKKIHSGRSRNDQVLVDLKMYYRDALKSIVTEMESLFSMLIELSEQHKEVLLPGYTHFQVAMPSSFGLWFGAYAESLADDLFVLLAAYQIANQNPLGSAAGYGSSFPLDRDFTTTLLGFTNLNVNAVYAQMTRGKTELAVAHALGSLAYTLNKLASDVVLYVSQNFGFISFPNDVMEGSSIMPHKKNPDVFELIRAKTNKWKILSAEIQIATANLPSGYHRDMQMLKEWLFPAFEDLRACMDLSCMMLSKIMVVDKSNLPQYVDMYSVERVNEIVLTGVPFRDAYKQVAVDIENGTLQKPKSLKHTHIGSMGNLGNDRIVQFFTERKKMFEFDKVSKAIEHLFQI